MASALTATSLRTSFLYLFMIAGIAIGAVYLMVFKDKGIMNSFYHKAFSLNYAAFQNGIYLARVKFIANSHQISKIDRWKESNKGVTTGLDYNAQGNPIGTDIIDNLQQTPVNVTQCQQIWEFVLGPLKPELFLSHKEIIKFKKQSKTQIYGDLYWVEISPEKSCIIQSTNTTGMIIKYDTLSGKVNLISLSTKLGEKIKFID